MTTDQTTGQLTDGGTIQSGDIIAVKRGTGNARVTIGTAGTKAVSDATLDTVASVDGPVVASHLAVFADPQGTVRDGGEIGAIITDAAPIDLLLTTGLVPVLRDGVLYLATVADVQNAETPGGPPAPTTLLTDESGHFITNEADESIETSAFPVPVIVSGNAYSVPEATALSFGLAADVPVTWSLLGADAAQFTLAGNIVTLPLQDFENPVDADANNVYEFTARATNTQGHSTDQAVKVTVTNIVDDTTPVPFTFSDVLTADRSAPVTSNTVTVSGVNVPTALTISGWNVLDQRRGLRQLPPLHGSHQRRHRHTPRHLLIGWHTSRCDAHGRHLFDHVRRLRRPAPPLRNSQPAALAGLDQRALDRHHRWDRQSVVRPQRQRQPRDPSRSGRKATRHRRADDVRPQRLLGIQRHQPVPGRCRRRSTCSWAQVRAMSSSSPRVTPLEPAQNTWSMAPASYAVAVNPGSNRLGVPPPSLSTTVLQSITRDLSQHIVVMKRSGTGAHDGLRRQHRRQRHRGHQHRRHRNGGWRQRLGNRRIHGRAHHPDPDLRA